MKTIVITCINILINPIAFINILIWYKNLEYVSFKRLQYCIFSGNYSLIKVFKNRQKQIIKQIKIITIIFEIDYYIDQVIRNKNDYIERIKKIELEKNYSFLIDDLVKDLKKDEQIEIRNELKKVFNSTFILDKTKINSIEEYFEITYISIAMPCLVRLVEIISKEKIYEYNFLKLCSEIIRIVNDFSNIEKDKKENTQNIYNLFGHKKVHSILNDKLKKFNNFKPKNIVDDYLKRITKLGLLLYKKKDFEL